MVEVAKTAKEFGSGDIRLTYDQNIYIVDLANSKIEARL